MSGSKRSFAQITAGAGSGAGNRRGPSRTVSRQEAAPGLYRPLLANYSIKLDVADDDEDDDDDYSDEQFRRVGASLMFKDPTTKKEKEVGHLSGYYFDGPRKHFVSIADDIDQGTFQLALDVISGKTGAISSNNLIGVWAAAKGDEDVNGGHILVIDDVVVEAAHRGKRIGQALVKAIIESEDLEHGLALIAPGFTQRSDEGWTTAQRTAKLKSQEKYWMECGFRRIGKTDYFGRPGQESPIWESPMEDKLGEEKRVSEDTEKAQCDAEEKRIEALGIAKGSDAWNDHMYKFATALEKASGRAAEREEAAKAFFASIGIKF